VISFRRTNKIINLAVLVLETAATIGWLEEQPAEQGQYSSRRIDSDNQWLQKPQPLLSHSKPPATALLPYQNRLHINHLNPRNGELRLAFLLL